MKFKWNNESHRLVHSCGVCYYTFLKNRFTKNPALTEYWQCKRDFSRTIDVILIPQRWCHFNNLLERSWIFRVIIFNHCINEKNAHWTIKFITLFQRRINVTRKLESAFFFQPCLTFYQEVQRRKRFVKPQNITRLFILSGDDI